jgi:hypothetical protein
LKRFEQKFLLEQGIVLCSELDRQQDLLREHGISDARIKNILKEAYELTSHL